MYSTKMSYTAVITIELKRCANLGESTLEKV